MPTSISTVPRCSTSTALIVTWSSALTNRTNAASDHVTRFPAADPSKAETFKAGYSGSGLGIDSQGNVWVTNRFGPPHGINRGDFVRSGPLKETDGR
jgi:hypothetical protein